MLVHNILRTIVLTLTFMLVILFVFTIGPIVEARWFPVVDEVYVTVEEQGTNGVEVLLSYNKRRECEWLGVGWYVGTVRLRIDFRLEENFLPRSRIAGEHLVGPWTVQNVNTLEGTRAEIYHRCHPLWVVHNTLYPPRGSWERREHVQISEEGSSPTIKLTRRREAQ